jgi:hypothetical protein
MLQNYHTEQNLSAVICAYTSSGAELSFPHTTLFGVPAKAGGRPYLTGPDKAGANTLRRGQGGL